MQALTLTLTVGVLCIRINFVYTYSYLFYYFAAQVVPGVLLLIIGYLGCDLVSAMILWFIAVTLVTAAYAGAMASIVDIAPNLAGPVLAFAQTIHMTASFVAPQVAGAITTDSVSTRRQP